MRRAFCPRRAVQRDGCPCLKHLSKRGQLADKLAWNGWSETRLARGQLRNERKHPHSLLPAQSRQAVREHVFRLFCCSLCWFRDQGGTLCGSGACSTCKKASTTHG